MGNLLVPAALALTLTPYYDFPSIPDSFGVAAACWCCQDNLSVEFDGEAALSLEALKDYTDIFGSFRIEFVVDYIAIVHDHYFSAPGTDLCCAVNYFRFAIAQSQFQSWELLVAPEIKDNYYFNNVSGEKRFTIYETIYVPL